MPQIKERVILVGVRNDKDKYIFSDGEENNRRISVKEIARI